MANFSPPFSNGADFRYPTSDERQNGHDCGPADRELFNGLQHRVEAEIGNVIEGAGLVPTDSDLTQLMQAIQAMIDAATGGGATENYLLMTQARTRLPIFPEIQSADGSITVTAPAEATVRVPGGVTFMHRGIFPITTAQTDFTTEANKTYHIRYIVGEGEGTGLVIKSLTDPVYNPSSLNEGNPIFDSSYDNMLIARVITNAANTPTITNLINKHVMKATGEEVGAMGSLTPKQHENDVRPSMITQGTRVNLNFARTPLAMLTALNDVYVFGPSGPAVSDERSIGVRPLNRYQILVWGQGDTDIWTGWAVLA